MAILTTSAGLASSLPAEEPIANLVMGIAIFVFFVGVVGIVLGVIFLPTIFAFRRKHPAKWMVFAINLFFGWTVVAWGLLLAQVFSTPDRSPRADSGEDFKTRHPGINLAKNVFVVAFLAAAGVGAWWWFSDAGVKPSIQTAENIRPAEPAPVIEATEQVVDAPPEATKPNIEADVPSIAVVEEALAGVAPSPPTGETLSFSDVTWAEQPSGRDFERRYPRRALQRGIGGRVMLDCHVQAEGRLGCSVQSEEPQGHGFGDAALRLAREYQASPDHPVGQRVRVPIIFGVADER